MISHPGTPTGLGAATDWLVLRLDEARVCQEKAELFQWVRGVIVSQRAAGAARRCC